MACCEKKFGYHKWNVGMMSERDKHLHKNMVIAYLAAGGIHYRRRYSQCVLNKFVADNDIILSVCENGNASY